jgi:DNA ligase-associated metallophosphoesterase
LDRCEINLLGESFLALSAKALWWPSEETVFVADVHLGKAAAFRARSVPIPNGTTAAALARLTRLLEETGARRLIVLGDLWHDRLGRSESLLETLGLWTATHPSVDFTLITGNHDSKAGSTPVSTGFREVDELCLGRFCCLHHPTPRESHYVLCGHIHPGFAFSTARVGITVPCFWFGSEVAVLPAFGEFTGLASIAPCLNDRIYAIADDHVIPVPVPALR